MRRCDIRELGVWCARQATSHIKPVTIHRHRHDICTRGNKRAACAEVTRIFEPDLITRLDEKTRNQIKRLLRTRYDRDLLAFADDRTRAIQTLGNQLAKPHQTQRITHVQRIGFSFETAHAHRPAPQLQRREMQRWRTGSKRDQRHEIARTELEHVLRHFRQTRGNFRGAFRHGLVDLDMSYPRTIADTTDQITFGYQTLERRDDSGTRNSKLTRQFARRRQTRTGGNFPIQYRGAQ